MITVAIIGTLASVALPNYNAFTLRTRITSTISTLITFRNAIISNREVENKALVDITGTTCSRCDFAIIGAHAGTWATPSATAERNYSRAGLLGVVKDPWGWPYLLDENEHEWATDDCRMDTITSVGADGISGNGVGSINRDPAGDDIRIFIKMFYSDPPCGGLDNDEPGIVLGPDVIR